MEDFYFMGIEPASTAEQRGLMIISALINFADWLDAQDLLVEQVSGHANERPRAQLILDFLKAHSEGENYFMQAEQIAEILGAPFQGQETKR